LRLNRTNAENKALSLISPSEQQEKCGSWVKEQLGLEQTPEKAPVEVIIVKSASAPTLD